MRLPSVQYLSKTTFRTFFRFPFALLSSVASVFISVVILFYAEKAAPEFKIFWLNLLKPCVLSLPLFIGVRLMVEKNGWSKIFHFLGALVVIGLMAAYFKTLPLGEALPMRHMARFYIIFVACHLFVALSPYIFSRDINGFWQYNKTLFTKLFVATLYSGFICLGVFTFVWLLSSLLGYRIDSELFLNVWFAVSGVFNVWIFLAMIPQDIDALNYVHEYPKGLKAFVRFILLPFLVTYFIGVWVYMGAMWWQFGWPQGTLGYIISVYFVLGVLLLMLIEPLKTKTAPLWLRRFTEIYFVTTIPFLVILLLSLYKRVAVYGVTEYRYLLFVLAVWMGTMALYYLFSKTKSIKVLPTSLFVVMVLISFGPWGIFNVSEMSQVNRLEQILQKNKISVDDLTNESSHHSISRKDSREVRKIVRYLQHNHGLDDLQDRLHVDFKRLDNAHTQVSHENVLDVMNLEVKKGTKSYYFSYVLEQDLSLNIKGYDQLVHYGFLDAKKRDLKQEFDFLGKNMVLDFDSSKNTLWLQIDGGEATSLDLNEVVDKLSANQRGMLKKKVPLQDMSFDQESQSYVAKIVLRKFHGSRSEDKVSIKRLDAYLLLKALKPILEPEPEFESELEPEFSESTQDTLEETDSEETF